jgi:hypothetical protein
VTIKHLNPPTNPILFIFFNSPPAGSVTLRSPSRETPRLPTPPPSATPFDARLGRRPTLATPRLHGILAVMLVSVINFRAVQQFRCCWPQEHAHTDTKCTGACMSFRTPSWRRMSGHLLSSHRSMHVVQDSFSSSGVVRPSAVRPQEHAHTTSNFCRCYKACYAECLQDCFNNAQLPRPARPTSTADCNRIFLLT